MQARAHRGAMLHAGSDTVRTRHGSFNVEILRDLVSRRPVLVLTRGNATTPAPLLVRVHTGCVMGECLAGCDCACADRLDAALAAIDAAGRGAVFYLMQEGRGASIAARARVRMSVQASRGALTSAEAYDLLELSREPRRFESVAISSKLLGFSAPLRLHGADPDLSAAARDAGVPVESVVSSSEPTVREVDRCAATTDLPGPVTYFDPHPLQDAPHLIRMASHFLPLDGSGGDPLWFQVHIYLDRDSGDERIVLTHGGLREPLVRIQRDRLFDRFGVRGAPRGARGWLAAARSMVDEAAGCAVLLPPDLAGDGPALPDAVAIELIAHHVKGRRARLVVDASDREAVERACGAALTRNGIELGPSVVIESR